MTGAQVRAIREQRLRLSLRNLARVLRCSWTTVYRWEHGRCAISPRRAVQLAIMAYHTKPPVHPCVHCGGTGVQRPAP